MDQGTAIVLITIAALIGIAATLTIVGRRDREAREGAESPLAVSSEGMSTCPHCGRGNLVTDDICLYCGAPLPHHEEVG
jgi:hypothetical protein